MSKGMVQKSKFPIWAAVLAFFVTILLGYGVVYWVHTSRANAPYANPFLQVTNRDYSLFLWQNPELWSKGKERGYFSAFGAHGDPIWLDPVLAEETVVSPEYQLMRYHAWNIYARDYLPQREIPASQFLAFLVQRPEWQPNNWSEGPTAYREIVEVAHNNPNWDLSKLPIKELPEAVRIAFYGWRNHNQEKAAVGAYQPTYAELTALLREHPEFAREYWTISLHDEYPDYLLDHSTGNYLPEEPIPEDQTAPFLKLALYNRSQAVKQ